MPPQATAVPLCPPTLQSIVKSNASKQFKKLAESAPIAVVKAEADVAFTSFKIVSSNPEPTILQPDFGVQPPLLPFVRNVPGPRRTVVLGGKEAISLSKRICVLPSYGSQIVPEPGFPDVDVIHNSNWSGSRRNASISVSFTVNGSTANASIRDIAFSFPG